MRQYPEEKKGKELLDFVVDCVGRDKLSFNPDEVKYFSSRYLKIAIVKKTNKKCF